MRFYLIIHAGSTKTGAQWTAFFNAVFADTVLVAVFSYASAASEFVQHSDTLLSGQELIIDFDLPVPATTLPLLEAGCLTQGVAACGADSVPRYIEVIGQAVDATIVITQWCYGDLEDGIKWAHSGLYRSGAWGPARGDRGDAAFNPDTLSATVRYWYDKLQDGLTHAALTVYDPIGAGQSGNSYLIARALGNSMLTALLAFRATGDLSILELIDTWLWEAYQTLDYGDLTVPGPSADYLGWRELYDVWSYGQQNNMNKVMSVSHVFEFVYIVSQNLDLVSETVADHYAIWLDLVINNFLPDYANLTDPGYWEYIIEFAHPFLYGLRFLYYAYKITSNGDHLARFNLYKQIWVDMVVHRPGGAVVWDHRIIPSAWLAYSGRGSNGTSLGVQQTRYANYTLQGIIDLACEGVFPFALGSHMAGLDKTARVIFANGLDQFSGDIGGGVILPGETFLPQALGPLPRSFFDTVSWIATQAWRTDDTLLNLVESEHAVYDLPGHYYIMVPACMVFAYLFPLGR